MKHEQQIRQELSEYGLEPKDLTQAELEEYDNAIEAECTGGFVLDGIRSLLPEKSFDKNRPTQ